MKSSDQVKILENEFSKEPSWSKEKMSKLAKLLNLKESQIYKWNWDRRQLQDKYLMKRIADKDLPDNLFKVTKTNKSGADFDVEIADSSAASNGYFKVLRPGNFKKI